MPSEVVIKGKKLQYLIKIQVFLINDSEKLKLKKMIRIIANERLFNNLLISNLRVLQMYVVHRFLATSKKLRDIHFSTDREIWAIPILAFKAANTIRKLENYLTNHATEINVLVNCHRGPERTESNKAVAPPTFTS